jgi:hypothetical protein
MKLLSITRKEDYDQVKNLFYYYYGYSGHLTVDGVWSNNTWTFYNSYSGSLLSDATPPNNTGGNCLQVVGSGTAVATKPYDCQTGSYSFCEWIKDPKWK